LSPQVLGKLIKYKMVNTTSTGVAKTKRYWIASTKTPGFDFARPTAQMACSSPLNSGHWPSLWK